ncbi:MAG: hypothetical protein SV487_11260, partial [Thermodesulfobacteriota bacterium]|nr:hypothetical protein [Thermodesulfobacteriota bacterium]
IKEWNKKKYGEVKFHAFYYLQSWVAAQIMVECMRVADKAGNLNGDGLANALQNIKDLDVGGIMPPITIKRNSIPVAKMYRGNKKTLNLDPVSDWIYMD